MSNLIDFCRMTSSTGGTGALTCTAQTGYPDVAEAITGTRYVTYSIAEYTSSAKSQLSKGETGIGSYVASTGVLTRTEIKSTWNGTDYLPKFGTATAPTALSFGTTSANIDIIVSTTSAMSFSGVPFSYGAVASVSDGLGIMPFTANGGNYAHALTSGQTVYIPYCNALHKMFSQCSTRVTTGATAAGGTPGTLSAAIYEIASDGSPGVRLVNFGSLGRPTTSSATITSSALGTPIEIKVGMYYLGYLYVAGTDTGNPSVRGYQSDGSASPAGVLFANSNQSALLTVPSQTNLNDPATAPTAQTSFGTFGCFVMK